MDRLGFYRSICSRFEFSGAIATGLFLALATVATAAPVSAAAIHIVAIGASTTAGKRVGLDEAYPAQLEAMLRAKGYDVTISNAGVSGATSASMIGWADAVAPDTKLVLLQIAYSNDSKHGITAAQTAANRDMIVAQLRKRKIKAIFVDRYVPSTEIAMDGRHPDANGQRTIAARLLPQVMAAIGSRR